MSGPKLVGIACDEEANRRIDEQLKRVGKQKYFSSLYESLNIDLSNVQNWMNAYGNNTISSVHNETDEIIELKGKIKEYKNTFADRVEKEKIQLSIINSSTVSELHSAAYDRVVAIPKWKEQFIEEITFLFNELQKAQEYNRRKMAEQRKEADTVIREIHDIQNDTLLSSDANEGNYCKTEMQDLSYALKNENIQKQDEMQTIEERNFTLGELALIEMFENEVVRFSEMESLSLEDQRSIYLLKQDLAMLNSQDDMYSLKGKRGILQRVKYNYHVLNKNIASFTNEKNREEQYRKSLELEYESFCDALGQMSNDVSDMSETELRVSIDRLRSKMSEQEKRIHIEENMTEIMQKYGYRTISAVHLHDSDMTSHIIFEDEDGKKIFSAFDNGTIMMQVVGEGDKLPTEEEKRELLKEQGEFCTLYPEIKRELEKRHIRIESEQCAPVSEDSIVNIKIDKQRDIQRSTRKFSVIRRTYYTDSAGSQDKYSAVDNRKEMRMEES